MLECQCCPKVIPMKWAQGCATCAAKCHWHWGKCLDSGQLQTRWTWWHCFHWLWPLKRMVFCHFWCQKMTHLCCHQRSSQLAHTTPTLAQGAARGSPDGHSNFLFDVGEFCVQGHTSSAQWLNLWHPLWTMAPLGPWFSLPITCLDPCNQPLSHLLELDCGLNCLWEHSWSEPLRMAIKHQKWSLTQNNGICGSSHSPIVDTQSLGNVRDNWSKIQYGCLSNVGIRIEQRWNVVSTNPNAVMENYKSAGCEKVAAKETVVGSLPIVVIFAFVS